MRAQVRPHSQCFEDAPAAVAERAGAIVKTGLAGSLQRHGLDERHAQGRAGERQCQTGADHASADDGDIDFNRRAHAHAAAAISFSIASGAVGTPAVSTSWPLLVTATSSSMRSQWPVRCMKNFL